MLRKFLCVGATRLMLVTAAAAAPASAAVSESLPMVSGQGNFTSLVPAASGGRVHATDEQRPPILIPGVQEPDEMRVEPVPFNKPTLSAPEQMLAKVITGNQQDWLPALNSILASYPDFAEAYILRLDPLCKSGDRTAIQSDLNNALKFIGNSNDSFSSAMKEQLPDLLSMRAKIEYTNGDYKGAMDDLEKLIRTGEPMRFANDGGIAPEQKQSMCTWSQPDMDSLVQRFPRDYRSYMYRGLYFGFFTTFGNKWVAPATADLRRAAELNANSPLPNLFIAEILSNPMVEDGLESKLVDAQLHKHKQFTPLDGLIASASHEVAREILPYYDKALALDPNLIPALTGRAIQYQHLGEYQKEIADWDKVIAADPNAGTAYADRGSAKMQLGQNYEAIADFTMAIRIQGRKGLDSTILSNALIAMSYESRADAYMNTRQWSLAIKDLTTAISIQVGQDSMSMGINQFRALYPEYNSASDQALARKLNQTFYPNIKYEDFAQEFLHNNASRKYLPTDLHDLYLKRLRAYLNKGDWHSAVSDFRRVTNGFPDMPIERWQEFDRTGHYYIDMKTFDDSNKDSVKLQIKQANADGASTGPDTLQRFLLNCSSNQIRHLSTIPTNVLEELPPRSLLRSLNASGWQNVAPNSLGEKLRDGACSASAPL